MSRENYTIEPKGKTARELAAQQGWSETKAKFILENFVIKGLAQHGPDDTYIITGAGLAIGEYAGMVKPFDPIHGYGDAEGNLPPAK